MSFITISKTNFFHNLTVLSQRLGSREKLAVVLKDNAYGHGLLLMAKLSQEFGIKRAIVKTEKEAHDIKDFFEDIVVLNPEFKTCDFSLVVNSIEKLNFATTSHKLHLKVDTGMHRNGIMIEEVEKALKIFHDKNLTLSGVMTHFRSADELSSELFWQEKQWKTVKETVKSFCKKHDKKLPLFHSANSATVLRENSCKDDFTRCGIAIYGYHEMAKVFGRFDLKPVLKLYAQKISSRKLKKGSRVGYGGVGILKEDKTTSTYDVGYGDGFFRNLYEEFTGRVSMDSFSKTGDEEEVCIIQDAKKIAKLNNTISYDILVKLKPDIKRIVV